MAQTEQQTTTVRALLRRTLLATPWRIALLVIGVSVLLLPALTGSEPLGLAVTVATAIATVVMVAVGVRRHHPPAPTTWYLLAASVALFTAGTVLRTLPGDVHPFDDLTTLSGYAGVGLAALLWLLPRQVGNQRDLLLDSGLIWLGALLASWTFLISPVLHDAPKITGAIVVSAIYPVIGALLLTLVAHSAVTVSRSETSLRLVHLGLIAILVAGLGYNLENAGSPLVRHDVLQEPVLFTYALVGLAALHPSMVTVGGPRRIHPHRSRQRASVIAVILVVAALVPTVGSGFGVLDRIVVSALLAMLLMGVLARSERAIARSIRSERRAQYQADHDMLTGLLNRSALLRAPVRNQDRWHGQPLSLLFIDLDGFKAINDSHGHAVGDELIANAGARIRRVTRRDAVAARYGGDEFVVLTCAARGEAAVLAERLLSAFIKPFELSAGEVRVSASIGIACTGPRSSDATVYDLLREADSAMYHAKTYALGYVFHDDLRHGDAALRQIPREHAV